MAKRRPNTMGKKAVTNVDREALAEIQAASIEARLRAGRPLTKQQQAWWSAELATALQRIHALRGYAARSRLLTRALSDDRLSVHALAMKVLETLDDRLLGKPTELQEVRGVQTIIFTGIDPSKLPDRENPKPAVARPALPKEANITLPAYDPQKDDS